MSSVVVFISYSRKDTRWLEELWPHLQILEDELGVPFWYDEKHHQGPDGEILLGK
jgi:hypothetical protein